MIKKIILMHRNLKNSFFSMETGMLTSLSISGACNFGYHSREPKAFSKVIQGCITLLICVSLILTGAAPLQAAQNAVFYAEFTAMAEVVKTSASALSALCQDVEAREEQIEIIRKFIDPIRFLNDKSGYFYVYDYNCVNVAHAIQKNIVDKDLFDYKDSNGKYVIRELANASKRGGGFVDFRWQKPDGTPDNQKFGYAAPIGNTDFFIGSGVYVPENTLVFAFAYAKPPYVFAVPPFSYKDFNPYFKNAGIEFDIVREALETQGYAFIPVFYSYNELENRLKDGTLENAASVRNTLTERFYSETFVHFHNVAVTKKKNNLKIDNLNGLENKSIAAWEGAKKDLGEAFEKVVDKNENYREIGNQEKQGAAFFNDDIEVLIIDKTIFEWWLKEFSAKYNTAEEYVYHNIFPEKTEFYAGFKSKEIRDIFNQGLSQIKEDSSYEKIYKKYTR